MIWIIIPTIATILLVIVWLWANCDDYDSSPLRGLLFLTALITLFSWIGCPIQYYSSRSEAWVAQQYYESVITPNIIEEHEDYVVVDNMQAAIWQAGGVNLMEYNSYLVKTRYWQDTLIGKTFTYRVPEHLKYVRIKSKEIK